MSLIHMKNMQKKNHIKNKGKKKLIELYDEKYIKKIH